MKIANQTDILPGLVKKLLPPGGLASVGALVHGSGIDAANLADREIAMILDRTQGSEIDTPALLVDLQCMESNLERMATCFRSRHTGLRPHFKNHQVIDLALRQMKSGAIGITCASLEHAEALVENGIDSVLVANEVAGPVSIKRFVELSSRAPVIVAVDNADVISDMARAAGSRVGKLNVVLDLDVGLKRCGVPPGEAVLSLAKLIVAKGLRFRGLMGYAGNVHTLPDHEKDGTLAKSLMALARARSMVEKAGIPIEIVSCGATGDHARTATHESVTENQAGSYLLMDSWYAPYAPEFRPALSLLVTVISKTPGERIVVDAGVKALSGDRGLPFVKGNPALQAISLNAVHTVFRILDPSVSVEVGERLELSVHYLDATVSLHDKMYGMRDGRVEKVFKILH